MSAVDKITFKRNAEGVVRALTPPEYQTIGQLFEDIGDDEDTWQEALDVLSAPTSDPWNMGGDGYWIDIDKDGVSFSNQFRDDDKIRVSRDDARTLIRAFMKAYGY